MKLLQLALKNIRGSAFRSWVVALCAFLVASFALGTTLIVHGAEDTCRQQLWLDERGTSGDLSDMVVRCECGRSRGLSEASAIELNPLGTCRGARPWLGRNANEDCKLPSRLLIRTASNSYFPQVVSVLSLPDRGTAAETAVHSLWDDLQIVASAADLAFLKKKPKVMSALAPSRSRQHAIVTGSVAAEEEDENAKSCAGARARK
jgi:hypothetical protein